MFTLSITYEDGISQSRSYEDARACTDEFIAACSTTGVVAVKLDYYVPTNEERNPHCLDDGVPCASDGRGGCVACDFAAQQLSDEATKSEELRAES